MVCLLIMSIYFTGFSFEDDSEEAESDSEDEAESLEAKQEFYSKIVRQVVTSLTPLSWLTRGMDPNLVQEKDDKQHVPKFNDGTLRYRFDLQIS